MNNTGKSFEELDVIDDFLINAIATDPEVGEPFCRTVLSVLLQKNIEKLRIVAQKTIPGCIPGLRGIRMDVEIEEDIPKEEQKNGPSMNIYDLEPHLQKGMNFPRHNRFYQAKIDSRLMKSGEGDFSRMPNLYVLTITNFDVFGRDYMMYRFRNKCEEVPDLEYDDGLNFIYFYTGGTKGGNEDIKAMLRYMQKSTEASITNEATKKVHDYVSRVKVLPEVKKEFMKFDELMEYAKQKGYEEGRQEGLQAGRQEGLQAGRQEGCRAGRQEGRREGRREGEREGKIQAILELLEVHGEIPKEVRELLEEETLPEKLSKWLQLAAKTESVAGFLEKM